MITPPCKDCADRKTDCHAKCEAYRAYRAEVEARREERFAGQYYSESGKKSEREKLNNRKRGRWTV